MVAGKYEHIFRVISVDILKVMVYGVCSTHKPVAHFLPAFNVRSKYRYTAVFSVQVPGDTYTDMLVKHKRLILCKNADRINARVDTVA